VRIRPLREYPRSSSSGSPLVGRTASPLAPEDLTSKHAELQNEEAEKDPSSQALAGRSVLEVGAMRDAGEASSE
jgi:hypothetical protein